MKPVPKLIFSIFLLILISSGIWTWIWLKSNQSGNGKSLPAYATLSDFSLVDQNNDPISLKTFNGKIWIADFIFTRCAGPCPILSSHMQRMQGMLSHSPEVVLVSFSVDPEYDTPEVLAKYASTFGAEKDKWFFLTGDREVIFDIARSSLKLSVESETEIAPIIHSTRFVLIDETGGLRGYYDSNEDGFINELISDVRILLNEKQLKLAQ